MLKRSLSLLLTVVLLLTALPVGVFAEEGVLETEPASAVESTEPVVVETPTPAPTAAPTATAAPTSAPATDAPTPTLADAPQAPPATDENDDFPKSTEEAAVPSVSLAISPASLSFGSTPVGYSAITAQTINIRNSGNVVASLSLGTLKSFACGSLSTNTLAAGETATLSIAPQSGLGIGAYAETLTISSKNGASTTVSLAFEVTEAALLDSMMLAVPAAATVLNPPTKLKVLFSDYNALDLEWTPSTSTSAAGYIIERSTNKNFSADLKTYKVTDVSSDYFCNTSLTVGRTYYYRIRTVDNLTNPTVYSAYSNISYAKVAPDCPPTASATPASATSVKLTWTNANGATGVNIYRDNVLVATTKGVKTYTDTGLTTGETYSYELKTYRTVTLDGSSVNVESQDAFSLTYEVVPPAPKSLKGTSTAIDTIKLTWTAVAGVTGYYVWRSTNSGTTYSKIATVATNSYNDSKSISIGRDYLYYVEAYVGSTSSEKSGAITVKAVPPAVVSPKAVSAGSTSIKLSWGAVEDVNGYNIYHSTSKTGTYSYLATVTSTSYTHKNLTTSSRNYYQICSYVDNGTIIESDLSVVLYAIPLPAAPTGLKLTNTIYNQMTLAWNASVGADGYEIWRSTSASGPFTLINTKTKTTCTNSSITCGTTYYYKVRAYVETNGVKEAYGPYCAVVSRKAMPPATDFVTATASSTSVKLTWEKVAGATGYRIYVKKDGGSRTYLSEVTGSSTLAYTAKNLIPGSSYTFYILPYRTVSGTKVGSNYKAANSVTIKLGVPVDLKSTPVSVTSFTLSWKAVAGATGYTVTATCNEDPNYSLTKSTTKTSYTLTGLTKGNNYNVQVQAYSNASGSKVTSAQSATLTVGTRPPKPTAIKATVSGPNVKITWAAAPGADGYYVYRSTSKTGTLTKIATYTSGDILSYTDTTGSIGTTYFYTVKCYIDSYGTRVVCVTPSRVSATPIPATVKGLTASPVSYSSVKLRWTAVADANGYVILKSSSKSGTYSTYATVTGTSKTLKSLSAGTQYYFKVRAYKTVNGKKVLGAMSSAVLAQPQVVAPPTVKAVPYTKSVAIKWTGASGANGYYIYRSTSASGAYTKVGTVGSSTRSFTDKNLKCGTTYYYKVAGYRTVSGKQYAGVQSSYVSAKTYAVVPKGLTYTCTSVSSIKLKWTAVSGADGYRIYDQDDNLLGEVRSGITSFDVKNLPLAVYKGYYIKSFANNGGTYLLSNASAMINARTTPIGPASVTATFVSTQTIKVSWKESKAADGYLIYFKKGSGSYQLVDTLQGHDITQYRFSRLASNTKYSIRIRAFCIDANGNQVNGGYSSTLTVTTKK